MNRFSLILVWFSMVLPCFGASINLSNLDPRDFTTNGTPPATVGINLKSSQFHHTASGIEITNVTGVTGAGGGGGSGNLTANGSGSTDWVFVWDTDTSGHWTNVMSLDTVIATNLQVSFSGVLVMSDSNSNLVAATSAVVQQTVCDTNKFWISPGDGSVSSAGTVYGDNLYATNDCSALTFTDRSSSPDSLEDAYRIVQSHATRNGRVDHGKLNRLAWGHDKKGQPDPSSRDIGMVLSAQQMVIQDLLSRVERLEKK